MFSLLHLRMAFCAVFADTIDVVRSVFLCFTKAGRNFAQVQIHQHTAWGHLAVEPMRNLGTPPGGGAQWIPCGSLARCVGGVGSGSRALHYHTALGQLAVELLQCSA